MSDRDVPVIVEVTQSFLVYVPEEEAQQAVETGDSGDWDLHKRGDSFETNYVVRFPDYIDRLSIRDWEAHDEIGPRTPEGHFHSEAVRARWRAESEARVAAVAVRRASRQ